MSQEQKEQENAADPDADSGDDSAQEAAQQEEKEVEEAKQTMSELEEGDPPKDLADWPGGKAKYQTYGGPDGEEGYDDAATQKLGPSSLRHHEEPWWARTRRTPTTTPRSATARRTTRRTTRAANRA